MKQLLALVAVGLFAAAAHADTPRQGAEGQPPITPGEGPAYFVWHDDAGWHLRWTGKSEGPQAAFTGIIGVPGGRVSTIKPEMQGGNDSLNRIDQARAFFKSEAGIGVEGVDFKVEPADVGAGALALELYIDYKPIAAAAVHVGAGRTSPEAVQPAVRIELNLPKPQP